MKTILLVLCTLALCCCNKKDSRQNLSTGNLAVQNFTIDPSRDTSLITRSNVKINILKGTFSDNGLVKIEVKEAISITDMVLARLTTTSNNNPLLSGGMIQLRGKQNGLEPRILKPIEISVPTNDYNANMLRFSGEEKADSSVNWTKPETLLNRDEKSLVLDGRNIFQKNCATCHSLTKVVNRSTPGICNKKKVYGLAEEGNKKYIIHDTRR
jgi:mono/diheme cytochrome c family protein